jgi:hypothetical protein
MKTATMTEAQMRKQVNKVATVITIVIATAAICYIVSAWVIAIPHLF